MARFGRGKHGTFGVVAASIRKARRWRGTQSSDIVAVLSTFNKTLLTPSDYEQSTALEPSGVTMIAIRGGICIQADTATPSAGSWLLSVHDLSEPLPTSIGTTVLTDEDVLAAGTWCTSAETPFQLEFNVKTARKLHNDRVVLSIDNNTAGTAVMQMVTRVLCLGG